MRSCDTLRLLQRVSVSPSIIGTVSKETGIMPPGSVKTGSIELISNQIDF